MSVIAKSENKDTVMYNSETDLR